MLNFVLNWWAAFSGIGIPASICPTAPDGTAQTAGATIATDDWQALFTAAVVVTAVVALSAVLVTYQTRTMGHAFARRWVSALFVTGGVAGVVVLLMLTTFDVQTLGCQYGTVSTNIPFGRAFIRSTVALAQAMLFFLIFSLILTRIARVTRRQPWYDHSRYPF